MRGPIMSVFFAAVCTFLAGCGGGGSGDEQTGGEIESPPAAPFVVADFSIGKFSIAGDTVLLPPFGGNTSVLCYQKGLAAAVDANVAAAEFNCPFGMSGGGGGAVQNFSGSFFPSPVNYSVSATAGESILVDFGGVGSIVSTLTKGESYGSSFTYSYTNFTSNYPASITGSTDIALSYISSPSVPPTGTDVVVKNKVSIFLEIYTKNSFGEDVGKSFEVASKTYEGDFDDKVAVNLNPDAYGSFVGITAVALSAKVSNKVVVRRVD